MKRQLLLTALLAVGFTAPAAAQKTYSLQSPDGQIEMTVKLDEGLTYDVACNGQTLLEDCRIGMQLADNRTLGENPRPSSRKTRSVAEDIRPVVPLKFSTVRNEYNQLLLKFRGNYAVEFRAYNDGEAMPGAAEVLAKVKAAGLQRIVVTGSGQRSLIDKLEHTYPGIFEREKMVTAFDVKYGKPHPEPYLIGLQKAGVEANEAIVVENAPLGVQAGVAAGIFTIGVNTGPLADRVLREAGADLLYTSMGELAVEINQILGE